MTPAEPDPTSPTPLKPPTLKTTPLSDVVPVDAVRVSSEKAIPLWLGQLVALVGEGESGKTWLACHAVLDLAEAGHHVIICDGEMSAAAWLRRFRQLGASEQALGRAHYVEMDGHAKDVALVRATVTHLDAKLVVWDSALSLISRTARSENDNAEVSRVYDDLREIVRNSAGGLIVDHTTRGSGTLISRGATAKFNALDVSYGVRLTDGSVPGKTNDWTSTISVEKDRHGLLGDRQDREALFHPLGSGALHLEITQSTGSTHRLAAGNPITALVNRIDEMRPPPTSANKACEALGGTRAQVLTAYRIWKENQ